MHPTEALTTMSFANFLRETDAVGMFVFVLLVIMSVVSWYFMIIKCIRMVRIRTRSNHVVSSFWKTPTDQAIGYLENQPDWEPFSKIALDAEFAMQHHHQRHEGLAPGRDAEPLRVRRPRAAPGRHPRERAPRDRPDRACDRRFAPRRSSACSAPCGASTTR